MKISEQMKIIENWTLGQKPESIRAKRDGRLYSIPKADQKSALLTQAFYKIRSLVTKLIREGLWFVRPKKSERLIKIYHDIGFDKSLESTQRNHLIKALEKHILQLDAKASKAETEKNKPRLSRSQKRKLGAEVERKQKLKNQFINLKAELLISEEIIKLKKTYPDYIKHLDEGLKRLEGLPTTTQPNEITKIIDDLILQISPSEEEQIIQPGGNDNAQILTSDLIAENGTDAHQNILPEDILPEERIPEQHAPTKQQAAQDISRVQSTEEIAKQQAGYALAQRLETLKPLIATEALAIPVISAPLSSEEPMPPRASVGGKHQEGAGSEENNRPTTDIKVQSAPLSSEEPMPPRASAGRKHRKGAGSKENNRPTTHEITTQAEAMKESFRGAMHDGERVFIDEAKGSFKAGHSTNSEDVLHKLSATQSSIKTLTVARYFTTGDLEQLAKILRNTPCLKEVSLNIPTHAARDDVNLSDAIATHNDLERLDLLSLMISVDDSFLEKLLTSSPGLKKLRFIEANFSSNGVETLKKFQNLTDLHITKPRQKEASQVIMEMLKDGLAVKDLAIDDSNQYLKTLIENSIRFPRLRHLKIKSCRKLDTMMDLLVSNLKQVQELTIDSRSLRGESNENHLPMQVKEGHLTKRQCQLLSKLEPLNLKKLSLINIMYSFGNEEFKALEQLKTLEELNVPYPTNGGEYHTIDHLIKNLPNLKKINFYSPMEISEVDSESPNSNRIDSKKMPEHEIKKLKEAFSSRELDITATTPTIVESYFI